MAGEQLARLIKDCQTKEGELSDLVYGVVTSTTPLTIRVDNRFSVGSRHLLLSQMVRNLSLPVTVSVTVNGESGQGTGTVQVFRPLQTGDRVKMLRVSKGQKYYVLERS